MGVGAWLIWNREYGCWEMLRVAVLDLVMDTDVMQCLPAGAGNVTWI